MKTKKESELNQQEFKEFKSKTWEYFISQKIKEIGLFFAIVLGGLFIPFLFGKLIGLDACMTAIDGEPLWGCATFWSYWMGGLLMVFGLVLVGLSIYFLIGYNLEKAKRRAREDLNIEEEGYFL